MNAYFSYQVSISLTNAKNKFI